MATESEPASECEILSEVIAPNEGDLSADVARSVLRWTFTKRAIKRMNALADRNRRGEASDEELAELSRYLRVGSLINLVQAKARLSLKGTLAREP
jgi:hypothetical protein